MKYSKKIYGVFIGAALCSLSGCKMYITPEDASVAAHYSDTVSDIPVEICLNEEELDAAKQGSYIDVSIQEYPYEEAAEIFSGLSGDVVENNTLNSTWEEDNGETGWGKVLNYGDLVYSVGDSGAAFYFCSDPELYNLYTAVIRQNRESGREYLAVYLNDYFPAEDLESMDRKTALENCQKYADALGFRYGEVSVHTVTKDALQRIEQESQISAPNGRAWDEDDECYLIMYQNCAGGCPIYDINGNSSLRLLYSPKHGLIDASPGYIYDDNAARTEVELVTPKQALLNISGMAKKDGLEGQRIEIREINLGYVAKTNDQRTEYMSGRLSPCYQIGYTLVTEDQREIMGTFLVDAVTGYQITWSEQ